LRHRPQFDLLDDRCLLSTGTGITLGHHQAVPALHHRHAPGHHHHAAGARASAAAKAIQLDAARTALLEKPAGTVVIGTSTAFDPIIGAAAARAANNVDGSGMTVAVIDTGVDYNNPALGGGIGPGYKVIAGYDFAGGTANPMATSSQHGTAIAGLIGSASPDDLGVAPGVKIVALRVTDGTNTASLKSIASALQWVIDNRAKYGITSVNLSLADGGNYAQNWFASDGGAGQQITGLIGQLTALNVPVVAATGNSFNGMQGEGFAAIAAGTISVTATDLSGNLLSNAQRLGSAIGGASATTIAAPGEGLMAPSGDSGTAVVGGTSFATALTTGAVSLLQDIYWLRFGALPTVAQIKTWLQQGSDSVNDPATGIAIGELNIKKAAGLIPYSTKPAAPPPPTAPSTSGLTTVQPTPSPSTPVPAAATVVTTVPHVRVYVNGQQIGATGPTSNSRIGSLIVSTFRSLLQAMRAWTAGTSDQSGQVVTQVQIWNA
jgi:type VI secretion system secreted protein VgrG